MKEELEQKIINEAPYMFRYGGWNNPQMSLICFGFECGDGWYSIIRDLVIKISEIDKEKAIRVVQVKEKFGTLRFYTNGCKEPLFSKVHDLITEAEKRTGATCEVCGNPGITRGFSWIYTMCDECWQKKQDSE